MLDNGDCTLIITPEHKTILIDGGGSENYDIGKNILIPFLLNKGIMKIDYIILSHLDLDHVRRNFKCYTRTKYWTSNYFKTG